MLHEDAKFIIERQQIRSRDGLITKKLSYAEMAILIALIHAKGDVVSRDELMSLGWPGKIVVPNSLNMAILSLRRTLNFFSMGDNIITIPKIGFSLDHSILFVVSEEQKSVNVDVDNKNEIELAVINDVGLYSDIHSTRQQGQKSLKFTYENIRSSLVNVVLLFLFFLSVYVILLYLSHEPKLVCETFEGRVNVCTTADFTDELRGGVSNYLSEMEVKNNGTLLVEKNPHRLGGYGFYFLKKE